MSRRSLLLIFVVFLTNLSINAQSLYPEDEQVRVDDAVSTFASPTPTPTPLPLRTLWRDIARDEKKLVTRPFHVTKSELKWIVPVALATGAVIATDRHTSAWVSRNGSLGPVAHKVSYAGSIYTTAGLSGGLYLIGRGTGNEHLRETGRLSLEALADVYLLNSGLKTVFHRSRPNFENGRGQFFDHGRSFPSGHAAQSWAVATVIAHQYHDRKWIKLAAYATAATISLARYAGRNHFLSDIFVGSALGYAAGTLVYNLHH